jgi:hypothetical protein
MGYTHYWRMNADIGEEAWAGILEDTARLVAASPVALAHDPDEDAPPKSARTASGSTRQTRRPRAKPSSWTRCERTSASRRRAAILTNS